MSDHKPLLIFQSGSAQSQAWLKSLPRQPARKRSLPVQVRFATQDDRISTLEGNVHARAGDAIVTGISGEQWPVARAQFAAKYVPNAPCVMGEDGSYQSLPIHVLALRMASAFTVVLDDGRSQLNGQTGDWLVEYDDGALGIIAAPVFDNTYDIAESE